LVSFLTLVADSTFVLFDLVRSLVSFFFTLVVDSTFVLFDLVRWLVSLSFTMGKFWGYGPYTKIGSALKKLFVTLPASCPPHESNSVHAYIAGRQYNFFFWAAQKYLVAAQTHF
jgi:hypothetical protein